MVIQTITVSNCQPQTIVIGRRGTYDTLQIAFDLSYLVENYGSGTAVLAVKRSQDTSAYPAIASQANNILTWMISDVDTYYVGSGECQLMWYVEGGLAKTIIYPMVVMRDILSTTEEAPDAYENWVESLTALGAETLQNARDAAQSATDAETAQGGAEDAQLHAETAQREAEAAADRAEEAITHQPIITNGYWWVWNEAAQAYQDTGVKAEGRDGTDGFSPTITVVDITGGHRVTITDVNGTRTVDVMNGTDGTDGDDGYSPVVTVTNITGGHRVTITDKTHPTGQSFDVMDGQDGASDAGEVTYDETATYPSGSVGAALTNQKNAIDELDDAVDNPTTGLDTKAPVIINNASGDIASFSDGADGMQIRKIVGTIDPVQTGTGDPSPTNVRPISGHNGMTVTRTGKNMLDFNNLTISALLGYAYIGLPSDVTVQKNNNSIMIDSTSSSYGYGILLGKLPAGTYTVNVTSRNANMLVDYTDIIDFSTINHPMNNRSFLNSSSITFTSDGTHYYWVCFYNGNTTYNINEIMLALGSASDSFEPYTGTIIPITWQSEAGAIYGGLFDVISGELLVTYEYLDLGTCVPTSGYIVVENSEVGQFRFTTTSSFPHLPKLGGYVYCSIFKGTTDTGYNLEDNTIALTNSQANLFLRIRSTIYAAKTASEVYEMLQGLYAAVPILNPFEYTLTPHELQTLFGVNNIWTDVGAIQSCKYPADTKLYIDNKIATAIANALNA